ncbi:MAG: glycogen-branching enzyme, partial [Oscillospiraceae bacterium]|nr:glycogen-branching enzyme [Oscillospiraceae bacterium]
MDIYGFYKGQVFDAHKHLGAHRAQEGFTFRIYAPHAKRITLTGTFNEWSDWDMQHSFNEHFWEVTVPNAKPGDRYLYRIWHSDVSYTEHCDPYGYGMDVRPAFCSIVRDLSEYKFCDSSWMRRRSDCKDKPLHIYELHCGSWKQRKKHPEDESGGWLTYPEIAEKLIPYVKEMGYNYI